MRLPGDDDEVPAFLFDEAPNAADELGAWADARPERRRKGPPKTSARRIELLRESADRRRREQDWDDADTGEVVALYAWCHRKVYGVAPEVESDGAAYHQATRLASKMLDGEFGGDVVLMVGGYVRWVWGREAKQFPKRQNDFRIGWRYMFKLGGSLLVDWRIAKVKAK